MPGPTLPAQLSTDDVQKTLRARGWATKARQWLAPTERGLVPLWSQETLSGDLPRDPQAREQYKLVRATVQPAYEAAWHRWLDVSAGIGSGDAGFARLTSDEQKALSEGTDTAGGFAVPAELAGQIISVVRERSIVRQAALTLPTSRDLLMVPVFDFQADWVYEVPPTSDSAIGTTAAPLESLSVRVWKIRAKVAVSNDFLNDQPALLAWLTQTGADQLALAEDKAFIAGAGVGQPLGLMSTGKTTNISGTTAFTISNTTSALGSITPIIQMDNAVPDRFRARSRWVTLGANLSKIRLLVDGQSRAIFISQLHPNGIDDTLLAHPVSLSSAVQADGTQSNRVLALVDLSQYVIATRNLLSVRVATETYGDKDQTLIYLYDRIGGQLAFPDAAQIGICS